MRSSAYFVPTHEASLTAAAARGLQGLGCGASCKCGMGQFFPGAFPGVAAFGRASKLAWYMPGVASPSQLQGYHLPPALGGLGAGAGGGRFNRSVSRGTYQLPFVEVTGQGGAGLGQLAVDPAVLLGGAALLGVGLLLLGGKRPR